MVRALSDPAPHRQKCQRKNKAVESFMSFKLLENKRLSQKMPSLPNNKTNLQFYEEITAAQRGNSEILDEIVPQGNCWGLGFKKFPEEAPKLKVQFPQTVLSGRAAGSE